MIPDQREASSAAGAREHVDAEAAPHQRRPVVIVRRRGIRGAGGFLCSSAGVPRDFGVGVDGDFRAGAIRGLEPDHEGTPRGPRCQHAVIQDQVDPAARRQCRQPSQQIDRLELQMGGPVRPRALQCQPNVAGGGRVKAFLRDRRPKGVAAESFQTVPPVSGRAQPGMQVEAVVTRVTPPDRGDVGATASGSPVWSTRVPARAPSATRPRTAAAGPASAGASSAHGSTCRPPVSSASTPRYASRRVTWASTVASTSATSSASRNGFAWNCSALPSRANTPSSTSACRWTFRFNAPPNAARWPPPRYACPGSRRRVRAAAKSSNAGCHTT